MLIFRRAVDVAFGARAGPVIPDGAVDERWFASQVCRNCGDSLTTPYCGACGQKAAKRLAWRDIGRESWDRLRLFEFRSVGTLARLIVSPGRIAREYVLGRRRSHMHPLKLLVALVAVLVLMLAANRYFIQYGFSGRNGDVDRMAERVIAYANWSFSLGIFSIFLGSWIIFRQRLGYNFIEHIVLALYCQNIILGLIIINLLPTLIWNDPEFIGWHKMASQYYVPAIKILIVGIAYKQFFLLALKSDWPRLASACLIYAGSAWILLRIYASAILWLVSRSG
ncbi:Protein of unknown function [Sphingomonas sp. YR710]|uniref:DUF3667 domain-containing protein n=1 Tax=Sphingomonas sp. YR710 TaxID=1882773 RepID=UPI000888679D|nr:DUF3667 domain-containing protein [Sphingomonas sp. YR710]SDC88513.1 Protein of unknown function [Sphingomonas sp. YR710]